MSAISRAEEVAIRTADLTLSEAERVENYSQRMIRRGRAELRRRFSASSFAEAVRRYQMSVDELRARDERLERLEKALEATNEQLRKALDNGSRHEQQQAARSVARIEDDFTDEERRMVREHREWSAFERNMTRWEEQRARAEIERKAREAEEEGEEGEESKPKPKAKPKAKPKPASRHPDEEGEGEEDGEGKPKEEPKPEPWWRRD